MEQYISFCSNTVQLCYLCYLKTSLRLREGAGLNTICGEHFDILQSGRVAKDARPVFFLGQSVASHDHNYFCDSTGENLGEYDGKIFKGVFLVY